LPGQGAAEQATYVWFIGAERIWCSVASVADRRVAGGELLINEARGVQACKKRLHDETEPRRCTTACLRDHVQSLVMSVKLPRSPRQANAYVVFPSWPEGTWCVVSRASLSDPVLHIWNYSRSDVAVKPVKTSVREQSSLPQLSVSWHQ